MLFEGREKNARFTVASSRLNYEGKDFTIVHIMHVETPITKILDVYQNEEVRIPTVYH
jgi:hypothetical protein